MNKLPTELLREIMLVADHKSLQSLCFVNQYSQDLCQDQRFWDTKFTQHELPLKMIRPFEEYKKHYKTNDIQTRIHIYQDLLNAQSEAYEALTIYNQNLDRRFTIFLGESELNVKEQRYFIPISPGDVMIKLKSDSFEPDYIQIVKNNDQYDIKYTVRHHDDFYSITKSVNTKTLIDMLTLMLYGNTNFYNFEINIS